LTEITIILGQPVIRPDDYQIHVWRKCNVLGDWY